VLTVAVEAIGDGLSGPGKDRREKDLLMSSNATPNLKQTASSTDIAIRVSNLGKGHQIYSHPEDRLRGRLKTNLLLFNDKKSDFLVV